MTQCAACAFWDQSAAQRGLCRHGAPSTGERPDTIARWPATGPQERCGDAVPAGDAAIVRCGGCRYWWPNPNGGLNPLDRGDERLAWWREAGHCLRHAPRPGADPGHRGFWPATHHSDGCAEGLPAEVAKPPAQQA